MKILLLAFALLSSLYCAQIDEFAASVNYERDYNVAIKKAKEQNKAVMLVVVADYCPWCKKFERKTLKASAVTKAVHDNFIPVVIDKYKDKGKYPQGFSAPFIPTVFFIDPKNQTSLLETVAYMKVDEFMENMDDAISLYKSEKK